MRSFVSKVITILILTVTLGLGWLWFDYQGYINSPLNVPDKGFRYELKRGMNLTRLVKDLSTQGVITEPRYILWYARLTGKANHIQVGEYELSKGDTAKDFIETLLSGKVIQYALTIV